MLYLAIKGRYVEPIPFWTETRSVVSATLCTAGAVAVLGVLTNDIPASTSALVALLVFLVIAPIANRLAKRALSFAGVWTLPVLVIGDESGAVEAVLDSDRSLGYRVVGQVDPDTVLDAPGGDRLRQALNRYGARRLLISVDDGRQQQLIECALRERVPFAVVQPYAFSAFPGGPAAFFSHDTLLLSFRDGLSRPIARIAKIIFDVLVAGLLLIVTSPLFLVLMLLVWGRRLRVLCASAHRRTGTSI